MDDSYFQGTSLPIKYENSLEMETENSITIKCENPMEIQTGDPNCIRDNITHKFTDLIVVNPSENHSNERNNDIIIENNIIPEDCSAVDSGVPKIEITEHSLQLENIQVLEDIYRNYSENVAEDGSKTSLISEVREPKILGPVQTRKPVKKARNQKKKDIQKNTLDTFVRKTRSMIAGKVVKMKTDKAELPKNFERLFVRLERIDISDKLYTIPYFTKENTESTFETAKSKEKSVGETTEFKVNTFSRKYNKTLPHIKKGDENYVINKTESLKLEAKLLKSLSKSKSLAQSTQEPSPEYSNSSPHARPGENCDENVSSLNKKNILSGTKPEFTGEGMFDDEKNSNETQYQCFHCRKTFQKRVYLVHHIKRVHLKVYKKNKLPTDYQCNDCGKVVKHRRSLISHITQWHKKGKELYCHKCPYVTNLKQGLKDHFYRVHVSDDVKPTYKCDLCPHETTYKGSLQRHMDRVHLKKIKLKKCEQCDWKGDVAHFSLHVQQKHLDVEYFCNNCSYKTKSKGSLSIHMHKHSKIKNFSCLICQYQTSYNSRLKDHMKCHEYSYKKCPKCLKMVKESTFRDHMRRGHGGRAKKKCPQCGKEVVSLKKHLMLHNGGNVKLNCQECTFSCVNTTYLQIHIRKFHTKCEMEKFICFHCNKELSDKPSLITHIKSLHTHNPCECTICGTKLKSKMYLAAHLRIMHDEVRWYECKLCPADKVFKTKHRGGLKGHMLRVHSNEDAILYKCEYCPHYKTKDPGYLRKHIVKYHRKKIKTVLAS